MAATPRVGSRVRYRNGSGRITSARVLSVVGSTVTLRGGSKGNGADVTSVTKQTGKGSSAGWVRGGR